MLSFLSKSMKSMKAKGNTKVCKSRLVIFMLIIYLNLTKAPKVGTWLVVKQQQSKLLMVIMVKPNEYKVQVEVNNYMVRCLHGLMRDSFSCSTGQMKKNKRSKIQGNNKFLNLFLCHFFKIYILFFLFESFLF